MNGRLDAGAAQSEEIFSWLRHRESEMAALLEELVAIPTENPPGKNYRACADLLEERFRQWEIPCRRIESSEDKKQTVDTPVCLLACHGRGGRVLYFHGHYDVVPAQSAEQFQPLRKEHFVFGRGSCDMKGGIVAMLYAILALKDHGAALNGRIGLTLVPNEETGGQGGTAWLASHGLLGSGGVGMLLPEPTSGVVWNANRGALSMRVEIFGKSAHVGLQHQGENAFERMHRVIERLQELKQKAEQHETRFRIGAGQARNSILLLGGQSGGGTNFNVVPEKCWFTIDRRINPEENLGEEKAKLFEVLEQCKREGIPLEWEILQEGQTAACHENSALGEALAHNVAAITGEAPRFEMCPGLVETRFYAAQGMPAFAYGPGLLSVAHGPNEYVDLRKVIDCAAIYARTAMDILNR